MGKVLLHENIFSMLYLQATQNINIDKIIYTPDKKLISYPFTFFPPPSDSCNITSTGHHPTLTLSNMQMQWMQSFLIHPSKAMLMLLQGLWLLLLLLLSLRRLLLGSAHLQCCCNRPAIQVLL